MLTLGWPSYLAYNISGPKNFRGASHYSPKSPIFKPSQYFQIFLSSIGVLTTTFLIILSCLKFGIFSVLNYYFIPYLMVNFWLVLITYLQHTDPLIPHYREKEWNFMRGALCTVDRDFGSILNIAFHHINDTHVVHHLFSRMPHYHAKEATEAVKKVLGPYYLYDDTHWLKALWNNQRFCRFVADEGDVLFWLYPLSLQKKE